MNYIHVHEKCLKCGECRLECEHRTKWTSASTSTSPNTESDKSIDEIIEAYIGSLWETLGSPKKYKEANTSFKSDIYSLLMDVIGDMEYRETLDMGLSSWTNEDFKAFGRNELRNEQRQKLNQLFNKDK